MREEREINIYEAFFDCLLHWRGAILFLFIGAILVGAFGYYKTYKESQVAIVQVKEKSESNPEEMEIEKDTDLTQTEITNIKSLVDQNAYVSKMQAYKDFFSYKNFDYTKVPTCEYIYIVKASDFATAQIIANKYTYYIGTNELIEYLKKNTSLDTSFVNELYTSAVQGGSSSEFVETKTSETDGTCIFRIKVIHKNEDLCKTLANSMNDFILAKYQEINEQTKKHELIVIDDSFAYASDYNLLNKIKTINDSSNSALLSIGKGVDSLSDKGKVYYDLAVNGMKMAEIEAQLSEEEEETENTVDAIEETEEVQVIEPKGKISVKHVAVGAVFFVALYFGILILFRYILNTKLNCSDDIKTIFHIHFLGNIAKEKGSKVFLGFIDKLIIKIRDRNKRKFNEEEAIGLAVSSVKIAAKKNDISEIVSIGCNMSKIKETTEKIYSKLSDEGVKVSELDNVLYNPESMEKLPGNKGAILIEQIGNTLYDEVVKEIEILKSQDIKVLGIITVEN